MFSRLRLVLTLPATALALTLTTPVALAQEETSLPFSAAVPTGAPMSFADLIEEVSPSVVSINARISAPMGMPGGVAPNMEGMPPQFREWFERQFPNQPQQPREGRSLGSGFFISAEGHIVTNNHVVENATEITVALSDGEEYPAEVIGTDPLTDIALLRLNTDEEIAFSFVTLDRNPTIRVGDWVVAVGNPFGLGGTATAGIVSATGRELPTNVYNNFLQIDAPINRGNSGGPTFNLDGEVVGVNSQIFSPSGGNVGIGFAIPSNIAANIVDQLMADGRVARGWLGVQIQNVTDDIAEGLGLEDPRGAFVSSIVAGGPAARAGFQRMDVITAVNGQSVDSSAELTRRVGSIGAGTEVTFNVIRDNDEIVLRATLGDRPTETDLNTMQESGTTQPEVTFFGMQVRPAGDDMTARFGVEADSGLVIIDLQADSEGAQKGLRPGDLLLEAGGETLTNPGDLQAAIDAAREDGRSAILVLVQNASGQRYVALTLDRA
ncbi:MAG: protease Do [Rhodobacterales bacterium CG15_BIG_FIL_POST_REV_8_21_14_020_59_13]|nr:MAG: protease Do [Rhodobacterales bacterium CG15_BIG_FIL_POST_REV_8_21_14_020_59_13]